MSNFPGQNMSDAERKKQLILLGAILSCFGAAWLIQSTLIFNSDASWLMLVTKRLLAGGNYTNDFFEINPPMILYVYSPAVYLAKILGLPNYLAMRIYIFTLIAVALFFCESLTQKIFTDDNNQVRDMLLIGLAAVLLFLPMTEFGQREHLVVILTTPYFLLMVLRLQNRDDIDSYQAFTIGIMAALGFVIKPYFVAPLVFVEIFYLCNQRQLKKLLRPETAAMVLLFSFFICLFFVFNRDYLITVVPLITHFYYQKYRLPVTALVLNEQAVFAYFALVFYLLRYRYHTFQTLSTVLMLTVCGYLFVFVIQQTPWYYHVLPLLMTSSLLFILLFSQIITQKSICRAEYYSLWLFCLALFSYLFIHMSYVSNCLYYFPVAFFSLFAALFVALFRAAGATFLKTIFLPALVVIAGVAFYLYLLHSPLQTHIFMLTSILLVLLFGLFIPLQHDADKLRLMQFMVLGSVIFAVPFYQGGYVYNYAQAYKKLYGNLLAVLREYPNQSLFFFSNISDFGFPALDYTGQALASRFSALAFAPTLSYWDDTQTYAKAYLHSATANHSLLTAVVEDFYKYKPDVVLVDVRNTNPDGVKRYFGNQQMDYIKFFSMDIAFKNTWQHYHYLKTVDGQPLFKFNIYLRYPSV